ncbi:spore germination protein [Paenibacillus sp. HJGM_3]|uniref:spore germination protein n=1 Tax=Paenibacillus sp. HJGM_3 TaxID=3379816 RepID=UPI0038580058
MPSCVGNIEVSSLNPSSIFQVGDISVSSPASTSKTFAGANSSNTGDTFGISITNNEANLTKTNDMDIKDAVK